MGLATLIVCLLYCVNTPEDVTLDPIFLVFAQFYSQADQGQGGSKHGDALAVPHGPPMQPGERALQPIVQPLVPIPFSPHACHVLAGRKSLTHLNQG